ncbi:MAG: hypothetical protein MZW92_07280 [Comamonadaceae bacterium]|nr:hypothetical protein [Comamonadaceae bacterium]
MGGDAELFEAGRASVGGPDASSSLTRRASLHYLLAGAATAVLVALCAFVLLRPATGRAAGHPGNGAAQCGVAAVGEDRGRVRTDRCALAFGRLPLRPRRHRRRRTTGTGPADRRGPPRGRERTRWSNGLGILDSDGIAFLNTGVAGGDPAALDASDRMLPPRAVRRGRPDIRRALQPRLSPEWSLVRSAASTGARASSSASRSRPF